MTKAFRNWLFILVATIALSIASCVPSSSRDYEITGRTTNYDATLVEAYSSSKNCGHKGHYNCEVFMGKLQLSDGSTVVREIDGFFYYKFIDKGKQPLPAYVALTKADFGATVGLAWVILQILGFLLVGVALIILMYGLVELPDKIKKEKETWK